MSPGRNIAWIALSCLAVAPARADELTPQKKADINHLLDVTGALALGQQAADYMVGVALQQFQKSDKPIPQNVVRVLREEASAAIAENLPSFRQLVVERYSDHFTHAEIKDLIRFYDTPTGKKTIREMPSLLQQCMAAGQKWGESLGPIIDKRVRERLKHEGIDPGKDRSQTP
jgi:uncharacterized protein